MKYSNSDVDKTDSGYEDQHEGTPAHRDRMWGWVMPYVKESFVD